MTDSPLNKLEAEATRPIDWESECRKAWARVSDLEGRKPNHPFSPIADGHDCIACDDDSIWKCDAAAHAELLPRWDADKLVIEQGWNTPERCGNCGELNPAVAAPESSLEAMRGALEAAEDVLRYVLRWVRLTPGVDDPNALACADQDLEGQFWEWSQSQPEAFARIIAVEDSALAPTPEEN